jgi:hypothetical protein
VGKRGRCKSVKGWQTGKGWSRGKEGGLEMEERGRVRGGKMGKVKGGEKEEG